MNSKNFGAFIAGLRKERELTQQELSEKLKIKTKILSSWELGKYLPDLSQLKLLGEELNISAEELLNGEKSYEKSSQGNDDRTEITAVISYEKERKRCIKNSKKKLAAAVSACILLISGIKTAADKIFYAPSEWKEGDVSEWSRLFPDHSAYELALNEDNRPVFKSPAEALAKAQSDFSDAAAVLRKEFRFLPMSKYNCYKYGKFGWQIVSEDERIRNQGQKLTQFADIYENSFK